MLTLPVAPVVTVTLYVASPAGTAVLPTAMAAPVFAVAESAMVPFVGVSAAVTPTVDAVVAAAVRVSAGMPTLRSKVVPAAAESGALSLTLIEVLLNGPPVQV